MANATLVLGPVILRDFEIPDIVGFGGKQSLAIHQLIGGERIVDTLGRNDATVTFRGTFSGSEATARARLIDSLRVAGQALPLIWDVYYYTVVVASFAADYRNPWWIPFRVACAVVRDEAYAPVASVVSLIGSLTADVGTAAALASAVGYDLSAPQAMLSVPGVATYGSSAYSNGCAILQAGYVAIGSARDAAGTGLETQTLALNAGGMGSIAALGNADSSAQRLAYLSYASGYLGRSSVNLSNAGT